MMPFRTPVLVLVSVAIFGVVTLVTISCVCLSYNIFGCSSTCGLRGLLRRAEVVLDQLGLDQLGFDQLGLDQLGLDQLGFVHLLVRGQWTHRTALAIGSWSRRLRHLRSDP